MLSENSVDWCSIILKNKTTQSAALLLGRSGCIGTLVATETPRHYRGTDLKTLIHSISHTNHTDITEPVDVFHQDKMRTNNAFAANEIDLHKIHMQNNTICNVQNSKKLAP